MGVEELRRLIAYGESLTLELKGEERGAISDRELYEAVVCLANVDGGTLLIGVENDGRITGARPRHGTTADSGKLQAAIFNNTEPRINARVSVIPTREGDVIAIAVDRYPEICATKAGVSLRRVLITSGKMSRNERVMSGAQKRKGGYERAHNSLISKPGVIQATWETSLLESITD